MFIEAKKTMVCSPSDYTKKVPQAGVAIVGGKKVRVVEAQAKTEHFQKCIDEGRAVKCYIDGGWCDNMVFYEVYCEAGGTTQAKNHNDAIAEAIRAEMVGEEGVPTAIMGDFNCTPDEIPNFKELLEEESWIDVGHCADWWGGVADQTTCHQCAAAKESRIDGILLKM